VKAEQQESYKPKNVDEERPLLGAIRTIKLHSNIYYLPSHLAEAQRFYIISSFSIPISPFIFPLSLARQKSRVKRNTGFCAWFCHFWLCDPGQVSLPLSFLTVITGLLTII
jgi:hypothetical protein